MNRLNVTREDIVLIIPALNPDSALIKLIQDLAPIWDRPVVIVDDGSGEEARTGIFPLARDLGCDVITNNINLGKGRALKNAFNHILNTYPLAVGAVTADADYQHNPTDILACAQALSESSEPKPLVLGCRDFDNPNVPPKSMLGNKITRNFMRIMNGVDVSDTQTGLRAISVEFMKQLLNVSGERFEFEANMLIEAAKSGIPFKDVTIQTVYIDSNRSTSFDSVKDSARIYLNLFKACRKKLAAIAAVTVGTAFAVKLAARLIGRTVKGSRD